MPKPIARQLIVNLDEDLNNKLEAIKSNFGFNSLSETLRFVLSQYHKTLN